MQDLIERLEKLMGPDRDMDSAIAGAVGIIPAGFEHIYKRVPGGGRWTAQEPYRTWDAPEYTASIDAALTLAPKGFQSYVDTGVGAFQGDAHACVWTDHPHRISGGARQAFSPAIALCIAALKARMATSILSTKESTK